MYLYPLSTFCTDLSPALTVIFDRQDEFKTKFGSAVEFWHFKCTHQKIFFEILNLDHEMSPLGLECTDSTIPILLFVKNEIIIGLTPTIVIIKCRLFKTSCQTDMFQRRLGYNVTYIFVPFVLVSILYCCLKSRKTPKPVLP